MAMQEYFEKALTVLPGGSSTIFQRRFHEYGGIVVKSAAGVVVEDTSGNQYYDYYMGFGTILLGHNPSIIVDRVKEYLGSSLSPVGIGVHELEVEAAERIVERIPSAEYVSFYPSSSLALEAAIEIARRVTGRRLIVFFDSSCHQPSPSTSYLSSLILVQGDEDGPANTGSDVRVLAYNDAEGFKEFMDNIGCNEAAAVVLEPVSHCYGVIAGLREFIQTVERVSRNCGTLLVFNEWLTFPRYSRRGLQYELGVTPDMTVIGETAVNGLQLAALAGRKYLLEELTKSIALSPLIPPAPLMLSILLAVLDVVEEYAIDRELARLGEKYARLLWSIVRELGIKAFVSVKNSSLTLYLGLEEQPRTLKEASSADLSAYAYLAGLVREKGVIIDPRPPGIISLSTAHRDVDENVFYDAMYKGLREVSSLLERLKH